ncbi:DUF58 domain-containing protein [Haladaptatus cibarius]|uniref:DUF58 domain-containing protein n=1 Tax=Haladaptatus cibarius TaxID=453847 RepID=UPI0006797587|nr:DUF58 domain-containing protein [Haladaptatus cibarius]
MYATRRQWIVAVTALSFSVLAVVFARPSLVFGTVGVACWLLYHYYSFVVELERLPDELTVSQSISQPSIPTDAPLSVTLDASLARRTAFEVTVESRPPISGRGAETANRTVIFGADETAATTTYSVEFPTAGTVSFEECAVEVTDGHGLLTARWKQGDEPTVTVEQRTPANVHVGRGGKRTYSVYDDEDAERNVHGQPTVEIREYKTGDSLRRIDWNATARFDYPHIREYENEPDRRVAIFIDHRPSVGSGRPGETQFAYLREAALALVAEAHERSDAVGLFAVGSDGVTVSRSFRSTPEQYAAVRKALYSLDVDDGASPSVECRSTDDTSRGQRTLPDDGSLFAARIRPYLLTRGDTTSAADDPLFKAVRSHVERHSEDVYVALFTSDVHRTEVRNCVQYTSWRARQTNAFLAPTVLFDPDGLSTLDETYSEYVSFERFRRTLGSYPQTSAFEVGPGDRIETILTSVRQVRA